MSKRGHSLVELLVVMSMTSVIFTVGIGMLHRVMHEQKFADRDNLMHRVAERLSTKLRQDVHLADRAELTSSDAENEQRLVLNHSEGTVTYAVRYHVLEREAIREGQPVHRDSFPFPDNYRLEFSEASTERVTFTAFAIPQAYLATASDEPPGREIERNLRRAVMRVEASLGRDHRFLKSDTPTNVKKEPSLSRDFPLQASSLRIPFE